MISKILILFGILVIGCQAGFDLGPCLNTPPIPNFDINKTTGVWYLILHEFDAFDNTNLKCYTTTQTVISPNEINFIDRDIDSKTNVPEISNSTGTFDPKMANVIQIPVSRVILDIYTYNYTMTYDIWATDYSSYTLGVTCVDYDSVFKNQAIYVFSRTPTISDQLKQKLVGMLKSYGFDVTKLKDIDTSSCGF